MFPDLPARPHLVAEAAAPFGALVAVADLDAPTPCDGWRVRDLLAHLLTWTPVLADAGRGAASDPAEHAVDVGTPDALAHARDDLVAVWSDPEPWSRPTTMTGTALPGAVVGTMVLAELVLHAWDLARASSAPVSWPDPLLAEVHEALAALVPLGRGMGAFGPEVAVGPDAPWLDRVVALAGRDPWAPVLTPRR